MRILVSNDDGYFAPGITVLAEALGRCAEVTVVVDYGSEMGPHDGTSWFEQAVDALVDGGNAIPRGR